MHALVSRKFKVRFEPRGRKHIGCVAAHRNSFSCRKFMTFIQHKSMRMSGSCATIPRGLTVVFTAIFQCIQFECPDGLRGEFVNPSFSFTSGLSMLLGDLKMILITVQPQGTSRRRKSSRYQAPARHSPCMTGSCIKARGMRRSENMSEKHNSPPGLKTRMTSRNTSFLSRARFKTLFDTTKSTDSSVIPRPANWSI